MDERIKLMLIGNDICEYIEFNLGKSPNNYFNNATID